MSSFNFDVLTSWKLTEIRAFVKFANLNASGRGKADIIKKLKHQISQEECAQLVQQFSQNSSSIKKESKIKPQKPLKANRFEINQKVQLLESQVRTLYERMNKMESLIHQMQNLQQFPQKIDLEPIILKLIPKGTGITIDELLESTALTKTSIRNIEQVVLNLVDDGKIMVAEGNSTQKIAGYIGRLIRK